MKAVNSNVTIFYGQNQLTLVNIDLFFPQGTMISVNLTMLSMDKEIWGDPENFRPERYIKNGVLDVASDKNLPFGAGKPSIPPGCY